MAATANLEIEEAVLEAAWRHLRAGDATEALSCYLVDAVVAGDGRLQTMTEFARDARAFYEKLESVETAEWIDPRVRVINDRTALFSARVRWISVDSGGGRLDLDGIWTAIWVATPEGWRIASRHESFRRD